MPLDSGVQGRQSMDIGIITYAWSPEFPEWMSAIGESWISAEPPLEILFRQSTWKPGGNTLWWNSEPHRLESRWLNET